MMSASLTYLLPFLVLGLYPDVAGGSKSSNDENNQDNSDAVETAALNFLVLGDWGGKPVHPYTTPAEVSLANVMGDKAADIGSSFTLALGDNFYDVGVKDVEDKRFTETFEVCAIAAAL